jgi:hypothetical protein
MLELTKEKDKLKEVLFILKRTTNAYRIDYFCSFYFNKTRSRILNMLHQFIHS